MADALSLIHQIVEEDSFVLNDAVVERVLNLLVEVVTEAGRDCALVKIPGLGAIAATTTDTDTDTEGRLMFRFHAAD